MLENCNARFCLIFIPLQALTVFIVLYLNQSLIGPRNDYARTAHISSVERAALEQHMMQRFESLLETRMGALKPRGGDRDEASEDDATEARFREAAKTIDDGFPKIDIHAIDESEEMKPYKPGENGVATEAEEYRTMEVNEELARQSYYDVTQTTVSEESDGEGVEYTDGDNFEYTNGGVAQVEHDETTASYEYETVINAYDADSGMTARHEAADQPDLENYSRTYENEHFETTVSNEAQRIENEIDEVAESDDYQQPEQRENESDGSQKIENDSKLLPYCPKVSPELVGYQDVDLVSEPDTTAVTEEQNPLVRYGGEFKPTDCQARSKVAILIPFRNRDMHLRYFLEYMHPILQRQQLHYKIFVINQVEGGTFNRAKLLNVGFAESLKAGFECFVFHDVDLILTNDMCSYACQSAPVHLAHNIDKFGGLAYTDCVGGVMEMTRDQFERINGFSNSYWGWGGEDDDMFGRMSAVDMKFVRRPFDIATYKMIRHKLDVGNEENPKRFELLRRTKESYRNDGLSTLNYNVILVEEHPLYTNVTVDIFAKEESRLRSRRSRSDTDVDVFRYQSKHQHDYLRESLLLLHGEQ